MVSPYVPGANVIVATVQRIVLIHLQDGCSCRYDRWRSLLRRQPGL